MLLQKSKLRRLVVLCELCGPLFNHFLTEGREGREDHEADKRARHCLADLKRDPQMTQISQTVRDLFDLRIETLDWRLVWNEFHITNCPTPKLWN